MLLQIENLSFVCTQHITPEDAALREDGFTTKKRSLLFPPNLKVRLKPPSHLGENRNA